MSAFFERVRAALAPKGYEVLRELGSGGMGIVVLARQVKLDRLVAVKVIRPELHTAIANERFLLEGKALASLPHANIVPVYDADEAGGLPYYAMKYLDGATVADHVRKGPLPPVEVRKLGRDLLDALQFAHGQGVIHRDVKPANVFWDGRSAVLVDFGIAKRVSPPGAAPEQPEEPLTQPGVRLGTRGYMSPEQMAGAEATAGSDLFAAALVIYEAYTTRHWFDAQRWGRRAWSGVPRPEARVLRRALAWKPEKRWANAAAFRHRFWHTRDWRYQLRAILLTIGGLVVGAGFTGWLFKQWVNGSPPFRAPGSLRLVIVPFEDVCRSDAGDGERVARALVSKLQGYLDFSVRGSARPPWFVTRSTVVVRGTVCPQGDSLRVEASLRAGPTGTDPTPIAATGWAPRLDALVDTLAYGVVRGIWNRANPLDPALPVAALPKSGRGLAAWLAAERLLAQGRWGEADRAYEEAEALDSTCWLCAWRHAQVDKWLGRKLDAARAVRYLDHRESFPPQYQSLIRASRQPLRQALETLTEAMHQRSQFFLAHFMLADELYHRGPLIGHKRAEAIEAFGRVVRLRPDFFPAWEHLTWSLAAEGKDSAAKAAFRRLQAAGPPRDPFSQELRALLGLGLVCRFHESAACRRAIEDALGPADVAQYPDLAAGPRYLMSFDAPRGAILFGQRFAASGDQPDVLVRSGLIAQLSGYLALGLLDSARAAARDLKGRFRAPELQVLAAELDGAVLLLDPDSVDLHDRLAEIEGSLASHARSSSGSVASRRRAAWMLRLLGRRVRGRPDSSDFARLLAGETGRRPLVSVLDADAVAQQGHPQVALEATKVLTSLQADSLGEPSSVDPFFRTVLHLLRAEWYERAGDVASAVDELEWHENNDVFDRPSGPPQVADMDWAFATLARWRLARLLDRAGDGNGCAPYRRVAAAWAHGDARYAARADTAARRLSTLGCENPA